jgi:hypothetical protein
VAAPKEFTNKDNHGHSRDLLQKVRKAKQSFALGLDKHHRGRRTHHKQHLLFTLSQEHQEPLLDITTKSHLKQSVTMVS